MRSPTGRLVAGVLFTLVVIAAYAAYTLNSVRRMREVQAGTIDQNRKGALQLIRIQGDLNALALAMRDMLDNLDGYPLTAWSGQFDRIHGNLDDAIRVESTLSGAGRDPRQTAYLLSSFSQFWDAVEHMTKLAQSRQEREARELIRESLLPRQEALSALTARLLVRNNEAEQRAAQEILEIYDGIERNAYWFLALSVAMVLAVGITVIRSNRALFDQVTELSNQRRELARQLIATQEATLRAISRDLHDEFGQILTAVGAMLKRADRLAPAEFKEQVRETSTVVQEALEKIRGLSQSLQPVILEEQGLAAAIEWYVSVFQRQNGIIVRYQSPESLPDVEPSAAIHVFRILQEALNNVARHTRVREVTVQLQNGPAGLVLAVQDAGGGIPVSFKPGIGLAGMRERAALVGGKLDIGTAPPSGTRIALTLPLAAAPRGGADA
ncbi:MAG: sensor histidine kinase [Acidobacteria bacterium]|nr:sensor histidine kinase [Acidobacteriota bacterium]